MPKKVNLKEQLTRYVNALAAAAHDARHLSLSPAQSANDLRRAIGAYGCPECVYEIVHGHVGPYAAHTCEDWEREVT
jgi:hypothetical protein